MAGGRCRAQGLRHRLRFDVDPAAHRQARQEDQRLAQVIGQFRDRGAR